MGYSIEIKEAVIQKALLGQKSQREIARDAGIGLSTLQYWLKKYSATGTKHLSKKEKRPTDWTAEERFNAIIETSPLTDEESAAWCRKHGFFTHHIEQWKADALAATQPKTPKASSQEERRLKKEIADLKKELNRKDKALAETAALLVLKKKAQSIWGDPEED